MSESTDDLPVIDIEEISHVTAMKFAMMTIKIRDNEVEQATVSEFITEMKDTLVALCSALSTVFEIDKDDAVLAFPPATAVNNVVTADTPHPSILVHHAKIFLITYLLSPMYSVNNFELNWTLTLMMGSCIVIDNLVNKIKSQLQE